VLKKWECEPHRRLWGAGRLGKAERTGRAGANGGINIPPAPFKGGDVTGKHTRKI